MESMETTPQSTPITEFEYLLNADGARLAGWLRDVFGDVIISDDLSRSFYYIGPALPGMPHPSRDEEEVVREVREIYARYRQNS